MKQTHYSTSLSQKAIRMKPILLQALLATGWMLAGISCKNSDADADASGTFESTELIVSAEATGKVVQLNLQEGDDLAAGQKLGNIDTVQLYLKKRQLLASIQASKSRIPDVSAQIAALQQQIETAKTEKKRLQDLVKANAANQKQLDDADALIQLLQKQLKAQTLTLESSHEGIGEECNALRIQVKQVEDQLQKSLIISPIKGTVLTKYVEAGELAVPGKSLFKIADMDNMFLRAYITADQLASLRLGQKVDVVAEFGTKEDRKYRGKVVWIASKSEFTPKTIQIRDERANLVYAIKVLVKNDGYIKIGMYGSIHI